MINKLFLILVFATSILGFAQDSIITQIPTDTIVEVHDSISIESLHQNLLENIKPSNISIENKIPEATTDYMSAFISLISLLIGFLMNKWYENYRSNKKLKSEGGQWMENLIQLRKPLTEQISALTEYIPLNDENHYNLNDMTYSIALECEDFKLLDSKCLVPYLFSSTNKTSQKEAVVLAGSIKGVIRIIENTSINFKEEFKILRNSSQPYMTDFQKNFNELKLASTKYIEYAFKNYKHESIKSKSAVAIKELFKTKVDPYLESGEIDLFKLNIDLLVPLAKETVADRDNDIIQEVLSLINLCDRNIKALKMEKKYFRIRLEKRLKSFKGQLDSLDKVLSDPLFPIR